MTDITLCIAGLKLSLDSNNPLPIQQLRKHYQIFLDGNSKPDLYVSLSSIKHSPSDNLHVRWKDETVRIETNQFSISVDLSQKKGLVQYCSDAGWVDIVRLLYAVLLLKKSGFFLHASAVVHREKSYVFCGPSGSGKTTIACLSKNRPILTDETTAIVKEKRNYYAYATPFYGDGGPVKANIGAQIEAIFFIHKATRFSYQRLTPAEIVKSALPNILLNIKSNQWTNKLIDSLLLLTKRIPCYKLYFKPETKLWSYIDEFIK
ncbi:MAG: hypothetical protein V1871_04165 [Planctomycetota bacterium]